MAIQRLLLVQHLANGRALGVDQGFSSRRYADLLADGAYLEFGVHTGALTEADVDSGDVRGLKSRGRNVQFVSTGFQIAEKEITQ